MTIDEFIDHVGKLTEANGWTWEIKDLLSEEFQRCGIRLKYSWLGRYACPITACNPSGPLAAIEAAEVGNKLCLSIEDRNLIIGAADDHYPENQVRANQVWSIRDRLIAKLLPDVWKAYQGASNGSP